MPRNRVASPLVSVVIPTFNSARTLEAVLSSVEKQTYPNIEVIIVDNFSEDGTIKIAREHGTNVSQISTGRSKARNYGASRSKGNYLLFLDSDIELSPRVIEECEKRSREGFDAIILPEIIVGEGFWAQCRALEAECYLSDPGIIVCPRFFQRKVFEELGGYDEKLEAGEDWDIRERLKEKGFSMCQIAALTMHNEGKVRLANRLKKKYYYGLLIDEYIKKHKRKAVIKEQNPLFRQAYFRHWKLFLKSPLYAAGFLLMKALEILFVASAFIVNRLNKH